MHSLRLLLISRHLDINSAHILLGESPLRKEDKRLLTGRGSFTIDTRLQGELHISFVRSPYAHARIISTKVGNDDNSFSAFFDSNIQKDLPVISIWPGTPAPPFPLLARGEVLYRRAARRGRSSRLSSLSPRMRRNALILNTNHFP